VHVIPRPHRQIELILPPMAPPKAKPAPKAGK
jgi:microcompartment protein CcmL/EutN